MKLILLNNKHILDIQHETLYFDYRDLTGMDTFNAMLEKIKEFKPDLIIEEEKNDGKSNFTSLYRELSGIPKAWWMIDAHCNLIDHIVYAKQFEYIFCAQSWFVPLVQREVMGKVFYLPLCHTQTMTEYQEMLQTPMKKDIEFSFIGNIRSIHVERRKYVEKFLKIYPNFFARRSSYEDTLKYLRRSKSTFNCSLNNDLNFRVWEGIACSATVITDTVSDIFHIRELYKYITRYDKLLPDWQHLDVPQVRDGEDFIKKGHTLTHRMIQLLEMIDSHKQYEY